MVMEGIGRWVTREQATEEMGISLSTLDRRIARGDMEAVRQDRSVYVLTHGPEPVSDRDRLEAVREELAESEQTVFGLKRSESELTEALSRLKATIRRLEGELRESRNSGYALELEARNLRLDRRAERDTRRLMKKAIISLSLIASSLLVLLLQSSA